ncbi:MAG: response regulator [Ignavibacteria bacterium]
MNSENKSLFTILVIDDNPLELGLIRLVIQKNFPEIKCLNFTRPPDWENFFQLQEVDAIIIDYRLPEKNGLEQIKELRKYNSKVPAFLITALERDEIDQDIIKAGATDLIVKDRSYSNLVSKLNDIILKQTFKKFETEIQVLKKIINELSNLVILKIDKDEKCFEVLGNQKIFSWLRQDYFLNSEWKKYFYDIFTQLRTKIEKENKESANKEIELEIEQQKISLQLNLIKNDIFYLILTF